MFEDWIVRQNVARFRELLKAEPDIRKREALERLLAQEQAKLGRADPKK